MADQKVREMEPVETQIVEIMPPDIENLIYVAQNCKLQVGDLLYSGILIASLGAVMDVAMSISSTMESALEMISSPFSSRVYKIGYKFGLCEIDPAKSPLLSNTASHVPIPPGTLFT